MSKSTQRYEAGFTLMELMVVIVVIGILAAVAIPSYQKYLRDVRMQEPRTVLPQIRLKQQAYYLEFQSYLTTQENPLQMPCGGEQKVWNSDPNTRAAWLNLGFRPPTPGVYFQYWVNSGDASSTPGTSSNVTCFNLINSSLHFPSGGAWFIVCARGNLIGKNCSDQSSSNSAMTRFGMSNSEQYNLVFDNTPR